MRQKDNGVMDGRERKKGKNYANRTVEKYEQRGYGEVEGII